MIQISKLERDDVEWITKNLYPVFIWKTEMR